MKIRDILHSEVICAKHWPEFRFSASEDFLIHQTFDDEGATAIFLNKSWKEVNVQQLLDHPTAQWFLSDAVFIRLLPALVLASSWSGKKRPIRLGQILADHTIENLIRRGKRVLLQFDHHQVQELQRFVQRFGRPEDLPILFHGA